MKTELLQKRLEITYTAVDLYLEQGGEFTLSQIADELDITVSDIFEYFADKKAILEFYYTSVVIRYQLMIEEIDDFQEYTLGEKLSNFIYSSFDIMEEKQEFVEKTYKELVGCRYRKSEYEDEIESLFKSFFARDKGISASSGWLLNNLSYSMLRNKYELLVLYWIKDESEGKEKTMELTDKLTTFIEEVLYTQIVDKGLDLMKFIFSNTLSKENIPFRDAIESKIEIRS